MQWQGMRSNFIQTMPVKKDPRGEIAQLVDDLVQ